MPETPFKAIILDVTGQQSAADLDQAAFTMKGAVLDEEKMQEKHREHICKAFMKFLLEILFNALCPNLAYKPEAAVEGVKQIFTDKKTGNQGRLPMNVYMANL